MATAHRNVLPVFVLEERLLSSAGPYRRAMLLASVAALRAELADAGMSLMIAQGPATQAIPRIAREIAATAIYANAEVSPWGRRRDQRVDNASPAPVSWSWGTLTHAPGTVLTQKGTLAKVFAAFYKKWRVADIARAVPAHHTTGVPIPDERDLPSAGVVHPEAGSEAALDRLERFLATVDDYEQVRDIPALDATSGLSADLHFGSISPVEIVDLVGTSTPGREAFVRQLAWRDWYAHLMLESPHMANSALRPEYDHISWIDDDDAFEAWRNGRTGYPLVDAGMRQLLETGTMHNRVRMVTASFLAKHLLIDWRRGEAWFRRMLIDGDTAQNVGNWQWVAGTGPDAAPYFRIFNPTAQSRKFDSAGGYIRRWLPELRGLTDSAIHEPAATGPLELASAGVILGATYPHPIVEHPVARERCLETYKAALG